MMMLPLMDGGGLSNLLGKVDGCAVELSAEVVNVSAEKDESGKEETNEDRGGLVGSGGRMLDDAVPADNLDTLHVSTGVGVRAVDSKVGFALSRRSVDHFTHLDDDGFVFIVVVIAIVFRWLHAGDTVHAHDSFGTIWHLGTSEAVVSRGTTIVISKGSARFISENTKEDSTSLLGTVWSHVVLDFFFVVELTAVVVLHFQLFTLNVFGELESLLLFLLVVVVWVFFGADVHNTLCCVAIVQAFIFVEGIILAIIVGTGADIVLDVLAAVLVDFLNSFGVQSKVGVHIDDVVTVSSAASSSVAGGASVGRTKTESDEALGRDPDILSLVGLLVPLRDVVASLELDGEVNNPRHVDFFFFVVELTSLGEKRISHLGINLDVLELVHLVGVDWHGGASASDKREESD